jgi:hypothetical protein
MNPAQFEIRGLQARVEGSRVVLLKGHDHIATLTFRTSGVFSIVERGRGDAGMLPEAYRADVERATAYVLDCVWPNSNQLAA